ncbi:hypothetical protein G6514_001882 [Epicoccum nigrum]|nr:hypothetical protein G6514_001882 [Epicoccum nigrum]
MPLLELPREVFENIIYKVISRSMGVPPSTLANHRLVCRTFNNSIVACIRTALGTVKLTTLSESKYEYWMRLLGTDVLCWKVIHRLDPSSKKYIDNHLLIQNLSAAVDRLVRRQGPVSDKTVKQLRVQYTQSLYDTVKTISFEDFMSLIPSQGHGKPFPVVTLSIARAATGDTTVVPLACLLIKDEISNETPRPLNMLQAAVAANQVHVVLKILDLLANRVPANRQLGNWNEMYAIGKAILGALRVAVRTSRKDLALSLCDFLREHCVVRQSVRRSCYDTTWQDCVSYGNMTLFSNLLYWKQKDEPPAPNTDLTRLRLDKKEILYAAENARPTLIRHLVSSGILDPNRVESRSTDGDTIQLASPLWLGLSVRAYKVAKALIDCGADIDRKLQFGNHKTTAYLRAYATHDGDAQYNLLIWGADFRPLKQHGQPWAPGQREKKPRIMRTHRYYLSRQMVSVSFKEWPSHKRWERCEERS